MTLLKLWHAHTLLHIYCYILLELMKDYTMKICCLQDNIIKLYNLTNIIPDIALTHFVVFSRLRVWVPQCSKTNSQSLKKQGVVPDFYFLIFLNIGASIRIGQEIKEEEKKWQLTSDMWHLQREKNLGSRVALLPGKFFPVRKVFQKVHKKY